MSVSSNQEMSELLNREINKLSKEEGQYFQKISIPITTKTLKWEYGENEEYQAWVIADFKERSVGVAYCLGGFGNN